MYTVCIDIVPYDRHPADFMLFITEGGNLPPEVRAGKHGNLRQGRRVLFLLLEGAKTGGFSDHVLNLSLRHGGLLLSQRLPQGLVLLAGQARMGRENHERPVGIVEEILLHQVLEVARIKLLFQAVVDFDSIETNEGLRVIIEPGV